jgi:hypothetical protein
MLAMSVSPHGVKLRKGATSSMSGRAAKRLQENTEIAGKYKASDFKARRWVVEVCHSWFNRFRKLLVRYEKMDRSYGLLMLAASVIVLRKIKRENQRYIIYV